MEKNYQYNPYAAINACYRFSYGSKHSICRHEDSFELVGNRVTRIGAKQPEVVLLALDLQHLVVCPSQRNGPEVDAPFSSGGGSDRRMATALRLTPAHHQGQRRIVHDKMPNNPASAWAIFTAYAGVIALAWIDLAGGGDAGHAEACLREDRFNDLDLGGLSRSGCT
jgi:hypothetical protein